MAAQNFGNFRRLRIGERVVCVNQKSRYAGKVGTVTVEEKARTKMQPGEYAILRVLLDGYEKDMLFVYDEVKRVTKIN
jgi:hypothetical protein